MARRSTRVREVSYGPTDNCVVPNNIKQNSCITRQNLMKLSWFRDHNFRNGVSNHSFKFSGSTIGILLANAFMSNEVRTSQQEALLCLRQNRETTLTNDMSGCASSVRIQKGGRGWVQKHSSSWWHGKRRGGGGRRFHQCEEERSQHISIFYTVNLTSLRLTGVLKMKFIRDFTNLPGTLRLGRKEYQLFFYTPQSD